MKFINLLFIIGVIGLIMSCSSDELDSQFQEKGVISTKSLDCRRSFGCIWSMRWL